MTAARIRSTRPVWCCRSRVGPIEPGSAGVLEPLRRFCNTVNRENGADAWRTPRELADWLADEGYGEIASIDAHRARPARGAARRAVARRLHRATSRRSPTRPACCRCGSSRGEHGVALAPARLGRRRRRRSTGAGRGRRRCSRRAGPPEVVPPLSLGVPRHLQEPQRAVVLDGGVRRPQQGPRLPQTAQAVTDVARRARPASSALLRSVLGGCATSRLAACRGTAVRLSRD